MFPMFKVLRIGESQIPQILTLLLGVIFLIVFEFTDNHLYALLLLLSLQVSCVLMVCYDEHQDEKKANEEAFAMLNNK